MAEIKWIWLRCDNLHDRHFPDMMHGWNNYANDNKEKNK